jgi:hypothetical protein
MRSVSSSTVASKAASVPTMTGSGTDQCSQSSPGAIAHRHHQRRRIGHLVEGPRCSAAQIEPGAFGGGDRPGMDTGRRVRAG